MRQASMHGCVRMKRNSGELSRHDADQSVLPLGCDRTSNCEQESDNARRRAVPTVQLPPLCKLPKRVASMGVGPNGAATQTTMRVRGGGGSLAAAALHSTDERRPEESAHAEW